MRGMTNERVMRLSRWEQSGPAGHWNQRRVSSMNQRQSEWMNLILTEHCRALKHTNEADVLWRHIICDVTFVVFSSADKNTRLLRENREWDFIVCPFLPLSHPSSSKPWTVALAMSSDPRRQICFPDIFIAVISYSASCRWSLPSSPSWGPEWSHPCPLARKILHHIPGLFMCVNQIRWLHRTASVSKWQTLVALISPLTHTLDLLSCCWIS